ncbi:type II secretory pathway component [Alteromonas stellipolaris]|uniref:pilus assembly PilX family protein n=1 Tax=Alteromonas stellipolaris TaxID=233316 RepID=UPI002118A036|nr:type II secretory pathway component [Alteromonas stellipolaris]MCQ8847918.1 type II secretory pathway component [Alteromonas stellipolaris]
MSREPLSQQYQVHKAHKALSRTDRTRVEKIPPSTATLGGSFFIASLKHQRGSMLVMALFIMIVLALLGLTLASSLSSTGNKVAADNLGFRAQLATQAGMEHIKATANPAGATPLSCNGTINSPASFGQVRGLEGCAYQASCQTSTTTIAGVNYYFYRFASTAQCTASELISAHTQTDSMMIEQ